MARNFVRASSQQLRYAGALVSVPFSFACWFRTTDLTTPQALFSIGATTDDAHYLFFRGDQANDPVTATSNDSGVSAGVANSSPAGVSSGVWTHVGAIWASTSDRRVFLNGTRYNNTTVANPTGFTVTNIGCTERATPEQFVNGQIHIPGLWSVALTDAEMLALSRGIFPSRVRPQSLVDAWPFLGPAGNMTGVKGTVLTNSGTTESALSPRIYF